MPNKKDENQAKWAALTRASLITGIINKHVQYIGIADRRAQAIITINAIILPIALASLQRPEWHLAALTAIVTAFVSIAAAIFSLSPKKITGKKRKFGNLLHFSYIQNVSEEQYLATMKDALQDPGQLAEMAVRDIYYLSAFVVAPKFSWLKISYFVFLGGIFITVILVIAQTVQG